MGDGEDFHSPSLTSIDLKEILPSKADNVAILHHINSYCSEKIYIFFISSRKAQQNKYSHKMSLKSEFES